MKLFFRRIHLYLGLVSGLIITISCLTGAILVFEDDWQHLFNKQRYYVESGVARQSIAVIISNLKKDVPDAKIGAVKVYTDAGRTIELSYKLKEKGQEKKKKGKRNGPEYNWKAFANPYTGAVIDKYNIRSSFFFKVMSLHRWLLADDTGKLVVGINTFIFLFIIITGLILWWPANKNILKQRLKLKSNAGWKRTNHDLHVVLAFYSSIFLLISAFTGVAISFKWFSNGIVRMVGSPLKNPEPPKSVKPADSKMISFDDALAAVKLTGAQSYDIVKPKKDGDVFTVNVKMIDAAHESAADAYYIDAYTGKQLGQLMYKERSPGAKIRSVFKPIHTGSIFGWPSKLLLFIVVLIGSTLPTTGYIMWYNRTRKKRVLK